MYAKRISKIVVSLLSVVLLAFATIVPAMAATVNVSGSTTITFNTVLDMSNAPGASVPNVTFTYQIASGDPIVGTDGTVAILAGPAGASVESATFSPDDSVTGDKVTKTVAVDFSGVTFDKVGVYRYVITAVAPSDSDITMDENSTRYMDVYVTNGASGLEISAVQILTVPATLGSDGNYTYDGTGSVAKSTGFTNTYTTHNLTLTKIVAGTMGDMTETFSFEIALTGGTDGESFTLDNTDYTFDSDGTCTVTVSLKNEESATISGLSSYVSYQITENIALSEGYSTTATVDKAYVTVTAGESAQTLDQQAMGDSDHAVEVTNTREAVSPTGIILNVAPYALMVVVAVIGCVVFLRKRQIED